MIPLRISLKKKKNLIKTEIYSGEKKTCAQHNSMPKLDKGCQIIHIIQYNTVSSEDKNMGKPADAWQVETCRPAQLATPLSVMSQQVFYL